MTVIRTGATKKYSTGWEQAFGKTQKKAQIGATTKTGATASKSKGKSKPATATVSKAKSKPAAAKKKKKAARKVKK
jgi:hypothetical protein